MKTSYNVNIHIIIVMRIGIRTINYKTSNTFDSFIVRINNTNTNTEESCWS